VLSAEILRNIELSEISLSAIALKCGRLARLVNDFEYQRIFEWEAGGYPSTPGGIHPDVWASLVLAGRVVETNEDGKSVERAYPGSIASIENDIATSQLSIQAAQDPNVSISSSNPSQWLTAPTGNALERTTLRKQLSEASQRLANRRAFFHSYASERHYELKFSGIAEDIFSRIRERVDTSIGQSVPTAVQKITAVYENLQSENPEDWSNAVHSCRRILQDLADAIYPSREDKIVGEGKNERRIKLGPDNYINRLVAYAEENSASDRFRDIVGSHLKYLGERLDAIFQAAQKGSHAMITERSEADRYVVYTYMVVGDLLSLTPSTTTPTQKSE
jgi:hypothetical protein